MTRKALGRGLKALIPDAPAQEQSPFLEIEVGRIFPGRYQPRQEINAEKIQELAASIRAQGIIQPVVVRPTEGGSYELLAGERRWRAAQEAGLARVPAIVRQVRDSEALELALIENIQRENLNPIEEAQAFHQLIDHFHLTQEELAAQVGKDRSSVANHLRLLRLPQEIQDDVGHGRLSMGHARALLSLSSREKQMQARNTVVAGALSVRQTEKLVRRLMAPTPEKTKKAANKDIFIKDLEKSLRRALGTKVQIHQSGESGSVAVSYFSREELERITAHLLGGARG